jgi:hypothetical protein
VSPHPQRAKSKSTRSGCHQQRVSSKIGRQPMGELNLVKRHSTLKPEWYLHVTVRREGIVQACNSVLQELLKKQLLRCSLWRLLET